MKHKQELNRINTEYRWELINKFELDFDTVDVLVIETNSARLNELAKEITDTVFSEISEILTKIKKNETFLEKL